MIPPRREDMRVLVGSVIGPRTNCLVNASAHNHELWNVELVALAPQARLSRWGNHGTIREQRGPSDAHPARDYPVRPSSFANTLNQKNRKKPPGF